MGPGFASDMAGGLDDEIEKCTGDFELTIEMLQPLFAKPKLNEKLLGKPPFRFLHDVVMAVVNATGFATGLYADDETDSAAIKEKPQKIAFLEKIVKLIGVQLNTYTTDIKPAKIVSGLEPENTNRLLQLLALAATKAPDSAAAVKLVLSGDEGGASAKGEPAPAPAAAPETAPAAAAKSEPPSRGPSPANLDAEPDDGAATTAQVRVERQGRRGRRRREGRRGRGRARRGAVGHHDRRAGDRRRAARRRRRREPQGRERDRAARARARRRQRGRGQVEARAGHPQGAAGREERGRGRLKKTGADKNKNFGLTDADLEQLRAAIQVLCQSTNPLGKCMDYVNEDLGLMNRELEKWQAEARKYGDLLEDEKHKTDTALLPLKLQQTEVDEKVKEELAKIASLKAVIHKNDERIQELMNMTIGAR